MAGFTMSVTTHCPAVHVLDGGQQTFPHGVDPLAHGAAVECARQAATWNPFTGISVQVLSAGLQQRLSLAFWLPQKV